MKSIMKTYAMQIYSKISLFLEKDERELKPVQGDRTLQDVEVLDTVKPTKEQDAYLDLVGALGLRVKGSKNEADRLPTLQMIYQKLMS